MKRWHDIIDVPGLDLRILRVQNSLEDLTVDTEDIRITLGGEDKAETFANRLHYLLGELEYTLDEMSWIPAEYGSVEETK